jgi:hypothetical protein
VRSEADVKLEHVEQVAVFFLRDKTARALALAKR